MKKQKENKVETKEQETTTQPQEQPIPEDTTVANIGYSGNVKVSVKRGKRTIYSSTTHNEGGIKLFEFLAYCLCGKYNSADTIIPNKIKVFYSSTTKPSELDMGNITECSDFKYIEGSVIPADASTTEDGKTTYRYSATLHFRIPYTWLKGTYWNVLAIYGKSISNNESYAAVYKSQVYDETAKTWKDEWANIPIDNSNESNLVVDWTLTISDK